VKPRLLDLFCGAGGAARGYADAGFEVVGVDIKPQPRYPFEFHQADAMTFPLDGFDAIHASPPCQAYSQLRKTNEGLGRKYEHAELIPQMRARLVAAGVPYVIENVIGSPLVGASMLCGTSFNLPLRRHRLFETSWFILGAPPCAHDRFTEPKYWTGWTQGGRTVGNKRRSTVVQVYGNAGEKSEWPAAMGIDWMTSDELAQAIPPAYTRFIGRALMNHLRPIPIAPIVTCARCGRMDCGEFGGCGNEPKVVTTKEPQ
jgi:DNA (cytosine-5)-methyltransferase 1